MGQPDDDGEEVRASMVTDDDTLGDERLRLVLLCCHPALAPDTQMALTLRPVGGMTTAEVAAAFLQPEPTLAQRIVRAKRKIRDAGIPLSIPANLDERIDVVLGVLYLIFNEGYLTRGGGDVLVRVDLCDEATRLTRVLLGVVPGHAEVIGLLALQRYCQARQATRTDAAGDLVLLESQDRSRWDRAAIAEGNHLVRTAMAKMQPGPHQVQALIAAYHANARTAATTDRPAIAGLYGQLADMTRSPVVELNGAVAVAMADRPQAGLALLAGVAGLDNYHLLHATRAELCCGPATLPPPGRHSARPAVSPTTPPNSVTSTAASPPSTDFELRRCHATLLEPRTVPSSRPRPTDMCTLGWFAA